MSMNFLQHRPRQLLSVLQPRLLILPAKVIYEPLDFGPPRQGGCLYSTPVETVDLGRGGVNLLHIYQPPIGFYRVPDLKDSYSFPDLIFLWRISIKRFGVGGLAV